MTREQAKAEIDRHYPEGPFTVRLYNAVASSLERGEISDASRHAIRSRGAREWLRQPNFGVVTLNELAELIGGWTQQEPDIDGWE